MPLEGGTQERQKLRSFPTISRGRRRHHLPTKNGKISHFMGKLSPLPRGRFQSLFRRQLLMMQQAAVSQGET